MDDITMAYPDFAMSLVGKLTDAAVEALRRLEKIESVRQSRFYRLGCGDTLTWDNGIFASHRLLSFVSAANILLA